MCQVVWCVVSLGYERKCRQVSRFKVACGYLLSQFEK
jgi:hypothetical protein